DHAGRGRLDAGLDEVSRQSSRLARALTAAYRAYRKLWDGRGQRLREPWSAHDYSRLRRATWMGPTTQMSCLMLSAALGRPDFFLWGSLPVGNAWAPVVLLRRAPRAAAVASSVSLSPARNNRARTRAPAEERSAADLAARVTKPGCGAEPH